MLLYLIPLAIVTVWPSWRLLAGLISILLVLTAFQSAPFEQPLALAFTGPLVVLLRRWELRLRANRPR
ncbi:MAG: hypothetical protein K2P70_00685 [Hyphomonadaceae bacterium]|nr:hypothetical protein [Hyphomonadaceae bacterium]